MKRNSKTIYKGYIIEKIASNRFICQNDKFADFEETTLEEAKRIIDIRKVLINLCIN